MRLVERMLLELNANFDGDAWHGTPLRRILDGIDDARAGARPIPNARTIAELLAHLTSWIEIVRRRLAGEVVEVTPEIDFPSVEGVSWSDALARLDRAHHQLVDAVARMQESDFDVTVPGQSYTVD